MAYQGDRGLKIRQALVSVSHDEYQDQHRLLGPFTPSSFSSTPASDDFWKAGTGYQSTPGWHSTKPNRGKPYRQLEWYSAIALFASGIYSTLLSGAWLTIAIMQPHWGHFVDSNGSLLSPTAASTLATGLAKTIEMSFLTFFLATMGQYLTRTASNNNVPGISLADIQLKIFVVSPGTLFTQWRSFGRALRSFLGIISLIACLATMLYVTASESLVSPRPNMNSYVRTLHGAVKTAPANLDYIEGSCPATATDKHGNCIIVEDAGLAFTNLVQYLTNWEQPSSSSASNNITNRPPPVALFKGNVTVQGSWVDQADVQATRASQTYGRTITNVSMVMPHTGVVSAAALGNNSLPQVENSDGNTFLYVDAQTVVPALNVLCAEASAKELLPLLYKNWSNPLPAVMNGSIIPNISSTFDNSSVLNPIFGFEPSSPPPVFMRLPGAGNSLLNKNLHANNKLYLLLASGQDQGVNYSVCSMSMSFRGGCSTELSVSTKSSMLRSDCTQHDMSYNQPLQLAQSYTPINWTNVATSWAEAVALDTLPTSDTNAATPGLLAELAPQEAAFDPTRPSMVEALAVLAASTLLDSMADAPFDGSWPYNTYTLQNAVMQPFTARIMINEYASGAGSGAGVPWENPLLYVLIAVFVLSLACFVYLLHISIICPCLSRSKRADPNRNGLRKDCTEISELLQIALNSPQPGRGSPAAVAQKEGKLRNTKWHFRDDAVTGSSDTLEGLSITFDADEGYRKGSPTKDYFSLPSNESFGLGRQGPRGFKQLDSEDAL